MKKLLILMFIFMLSICRSFAYDSEEILIIADFSTSMSEVFDGEPKYKILVDAINRILRSTDKSKKIGLRVIKMNIDGYDYFQLMNILANPRLLCLGTDLAVPISSHNSSNISKVLANMSPIGETPLTYALKQAVERDFLNSNSLKHIIMVTDGGESCGQDPCQYITELARTRKDIIIDVIVFGVNKKDFQQLKCLAAQTSGTIYSIKSKTDLDRYFKKIIYKTTDPNFRSVTSQPKQVEVKENTFKQIENIAPPITPNTNSSNRKIIYKNYLIEFYQ